MNDSYRGLKYSLIVSVLLFPFILFAQIPNADFEQWSGNNPDGWFPNNVPGIVEPITQSQNSHSGNFAVQGEVTTHITGDTLPPILLSGEFGQGFPVSQRHAALTGYYQLSAAVNEVLFVSVTMFKDGQGIGVGANQFGSAGSYSQFNVPIFYGLPQVPDSCIIQLSLGDTTGSIAQPGSYFLVDDLAFSGINSIPELISSKVPENFSLHQNYPNPFNPTTSISFELPTTAQVELIVYNTVGQKVETLVSDRLSAGIHSVEFNAAELPSGIYYYKIKAGNREHVKRMILMK